MVVRKKLLASVLAGLAIMGAAAQMGTPVQAGQIIEAHVNLWADKQLDGTTPNTANTVGANSVAIGNNLVAGSASTTPTGRLGGTAIAIGVDSQAKMIVILRLVITTLQKVKIVLQWVPTL